MNQKIIHVIIGLDTKMVIFFVGFVKKDGGESAENTLDV